MTSFEIFKSEKGNRDSIFNFVLGLLNEKPSNILEIGCMRSVDAGRASDGWSTFFLAEYIKKYGGTLDIVDISFSSLEAAKNAINPFFSEVNYNLGTGLYYLKNNTKKYDLVHLDGSDDPNEMLAEYESCKDITKYILCDDFSTKGSLLRQKYPNFRLYKWNGYGHEVALYGYDNQTIYLDSIL